MVQRSQGKRMGNLSKPLEGAANPYFHIKNILGQEKIIELFGGWHPLSFKDKIKNMKNWLKKQRIFSIDQKKELEMTSALEKEESIASTSFRLVQRQAKRTFEETERSHTKSRQGQRQSQLLQTLPTRVQDSQIGTFSHGKCVQYGQNPYGICSQGAGEDEQDLSTKMAEEARYIQCIIK
ncbi:hypothetical protein O181_048569 [Austropuccinia psidii MF-1]|uniref:Uncharacterized protein n=1 Tax=Austropuccinia psidii MF-1 TaxID=1389203 RepID=A0A9Q3HN21_9BASI|nr:hypothetical protein [Austropuccinia psidii MF-1]